ncbi:MAG: hypothetical protein Q8R60_05705 [Mycobacteriales bacterium]|nr:hypothetical protein [Mycobacteriales bacterium]
MPDECTPLSDDGFSLVEVIVAMMLAVGMMTALAGNLVSALHAAAYARHVQSAGDLLMKEIEELRALPWAALGHASTDLGTDPSLVLQSGVLTAPVLAAREPVVVLATGAGVAQHVRPVALPPAIRATVSSYVTSPPGCLCRRVQVAIAWSERNKAKSRSTSTLVYSAAPVGRTSGAFVLGASTLTVPDAPRGTAAPVGVLLSNDGQQQPFRLTANVVRGVTVLPWAISWYADPNRNGRVDLGELRLDTALPGTGALDLVGSGTTVPVTAVVAVPPSTSTGDVTVTVTATSPADPSASVRSFFTVRVT